jgi:kumamolisin
MKWKLSIVVGVVLLAFGAMAQDVDRVQGKASAGTVPEAAPAGPHDWVVPAGSIQRPEDAGIRAHTNIVFRSLDGGNQPTQVMDPDTRPAGVSPEQFRQVEMPASLGCIYEDSPKKYSTGCIVPATLKGSKGPIAGGGGAIALVEAGDDPTAASDLAFFDKYVGLPTATFIKIQMTNSCSAPPPCSNFGWCAEDALDEEYSHFYSSKAAIIMVEACSSSTSDLLAAETEAFDYIAANYAYGEVSNSWGEGEFSSQGSYDPIFSSWGNGLYGYKVNAFASSGDGGCGVIWPSSDPWVIAAGGSGVYRNSNGTLNYEGCWAGSGGGPSTVETWAQTFTGWNSGPWADFQYPIFGENARQTPDFGLNADPDSGVWLYSVTAFGSSAPWSCCWGGTSESSPGLAAVVNRANNELSTCYFNPVNSTCYFTNQEDNLLYSQLPTATAYSQNFYSPDSGSNGGSCVVAYGWDQCTGVGNPRATAPGVELGK